MTVSDSSPPTPDPDDTPSDARARSERLVFIGLCGVVIIFLFGDVLGLMQGGGLFSILSAMNAVHAEAPAVEVDGAGLRTLFIAGCSLVATVIGLRLQLDLKNRLHSGLFIMAILISGFVLDAVCDSRISGAYMVDHRYSRCWSRDHERGPGNSHVWFNVWVLPGADCPAPPARGIP